MRIPREFELPGVEAIMRKEGDRLIIQPIPPKSLLALLSTLDTIDEDFPEIPEMRLDPVDIWCDMFLTQKSRLISSDSSSPIGYRPFS